MNYKVALLIETSNAYARGLLKGINAFLKVNRIWDIYLVEYSRGEFKPEWIRKWNGDGIIARIENREIAKIIQEKGLPTIDVSAARLLPELPWVETDDKAIAVMAAEHLIECGFHNFGLCGAPYNWSDWRMEHFSKIIRSKGLNLYTYLHSRSINNDAWDTEMEQLANWLHSLPKPVGLFSVFDMRGRQIIEVCQREKIRVPEDIAVLGVDNDELLCEICRPALSSILPDTFRSGYIAASLLDRLIRGLPLESMEYRIKPLKIVRRRSTDIKAIDDPHIAKAMRYIHEKALDGPLTVNQILKIIPFSRRIFEKRFKDYIGRTPTQEIERIKIERIKELLLETDISLMDIAEKTGIQHQSYMGYIFKKQVGVPPAAYRKQHR